MANSISHSHNQGAEKDLLQINQELRSQLEESKLHFQDLNEKFLVSEATAYSLANQLQKYQCGKHKEIIESVLGEKLQSKEEELAEKLILTEKFRESNVLIHNQAQELSQLKRKIQKGRDIAVVLSQQLGELLTHEDSNSHQGQNFLELLEEGQWIAECLILKLSLENHEDVEHGKQQESIAPSDDMLDEHEVSSLHAAQTQGNEKQEEAPMSPSTQLQEEDMDEVLTYSLDEIYLVPSSQHDFSDSPLLPTSPASLSEEHKVYSTPDVAVFSLAQYFVCKLSPDKESQALVTLSYATVPGSRSQDTPYLYCHENDENEEEKTPVFKMNVKNRDLDFLIGVQALELAHLKKKVQEGRDATSFINKHLLDLLTQHDPDSHEGQGHREQLAEGCRLAKLLVGKLSPGNCEEHHHQAEEALESLALRKYFLVQGLARELTHLRQQLKEVKDAAFSLNLHLTDLLNQEDSDSLQDRGLWGQLAEACQLTESLVRRLSQEYNDDDNDDDDDEEESLDSCSELQEEKESELLTKEYFVPSVHPDSSDSQEHLRSSVFPADEPIVSSALDGITPTQKACPQGPLNGDISINMPVVQASHAQVEPRVEKSSCLGLQLGTHFDYGDSEVRKSLSYTNYSFPASSENGKLRMLFQELNLDACPGLKNFPIMKGNCLEGSADNKRGYEAHGLIEATNDQRQNIIKRNLSCSKWRIACRFPSFQTSGTVVIISVALGCTCLF